MSDLGGADDVTGQKDLTQWCVDPGIAPYDLFAKWNWDETSLSGNNTADGCAMFDTDGDGNANYAVCAVWRLNGMQVPGSPFLYTCTADSRPDRCGSPAPLSPPSGGFQTRCEIRANVDDDPFSDGLDNVAVCGLVLADFQASGVPDLLDVCSFPSGQPNSAASDCIVTSLCNSNAQCDDGNACTLNVCDTTLGLCRYPADTGASCSDGEFCNGEEVCTSQSFCMPGTAPVVDDGVACTDDSCDEVNDQVVNAVNDANCDNGLFCDGAEICHPTLSCVTGTPPSIDDGVLCTADSCDEINDVVVNTPLDSLCDNGAFCDGSETCDPVNDCQPGTPVAFDDGVGCTADSCDEVNDVVVNTPLDSLCDNGAFCDGSETCDPVNDCQAGLAPNLDDGIVCTVDSCDEDADMVVHTPNDALADDEVGCTDDSCDPVLGAINTPNHAVCSNGDFCDGDEICDPVNDCQPGVLVQVDDQIACTIDSCDEVNDVIVHTPDDTLADDGVDCTIDTCDPAVGAINLADDSFCADGAFCNGVEICDPTLGCQDGPGDPCTDKTASACTDPDTCDEEADVCNPNNKACGGVTNSALCTFDVSHKGACVDNVTALATNQACDPTLGLLCDAGSHCVEESQFRLLFTPDGSQWPAYKLSGKNPGQYYYNAREMKFENGLPACQPGEPETFTIRIPYPFVTHGAMPVHIYDGALVAEGAEEGAIRTETCFVPPEESLDALPAILDLALWSEKTGGNNSGIGWDIDCQPTYVEDPENPGSFLPKPPSACVLTVDAEYPESCELYVNVHLDLLISGPQADANPIDGMPDRYDRGASSSPWGTYDAVYNNTDIVAVEDCQDLNFSHDTGLSSFSDTVQNLNEFKKIAGVYGCLTDAGDGPLSGETVSLKLGSSLVDTAETDDDGCYLVDYKHKGKPTTYDVAYTYWDEDLGERVTDSAPVFLKGNGSAEANYKIDVGWTTP